MNSNSRELLKHGGQGVFATSEERYFIELIKEARKYPEI